MEVTTLPIMTGTAEPQFTVPEAHTSQFRISYKISPVNTINIRWEPYSAPEELSWFNNLNHPQYNLNQPIILSVQHTDGYILVSDYRFNIFGTGQSLNEAFDEYSSMLVDYYQELTRSECELSEYLKEQLTKLESILVPR